LRPGFGPLEELRMKTRWHLRPVQINSECIAPAVFAVK